MKMQKENKVLYWLCFGLLIVLYLIATIFTAVASRSEEVIRIGVNVIPMASFAGIFSPLANICIVFLVLFYEKPGFILSFIALFVAFPRVIISIMVSHNWGSLSGLFGNVFTIVAIIAIYSYSKKIKNLQTAEVEHYKEQQKLSQHLFEQTATALVNAIDAKDTYSHGHSLRVAEYSEKIARQMGKSEEECYKIYYSALLHDVGKIGISDTIINKNGKLTDEEYEIIKTHPVMGNQILTSISEYPYISIGAHYHHERYDGKGYPDGLKGDDIPEIARIISVADAYDAMTSTRSYRNTVPQQIAREEIVKGAGTQFDPEIAMIMRRIIDEDNEYKLRERIKLKGLSANNELNCDEFADVITDGIWVNQHLCRIQFDYIPKKGTDGKPGFILFDSLDARFHSDDKTAEELNNFEYLRIIKCEEIENAGVRKIERKIVGLKDDSEKGAVSDERHMVISAVKVRDHVLLKLEDEDKTEEITVALPDSVRYCYIGITGSDCIIKDVVTDREEEPVKEVYIKRIAEEISYIDGPEGDIPNIQINGYRSDATEGIPITDGLTITFHTMSLPTARLVWHCPFVTIYSSGDKKVKGDNFKEYALVRFDGENWDSNDISDNRMIINQTDNFGGWDVWKEENKKGYDAVVKFQRKDNKIITTTENLGIFIKDTTLITDGNKELYAALTGDQVALTNIKIKH